MGDESLGERKDGRGGKLVLVAHCVLNQNSRVAGLAERSGVVDEIVEVLMRYDCGVVQMPCPELVYAGLSRQPKTKEQYDDLKFRRFCKKIASELAEQVLEYKRHGVKLEAVVGVDGSPSCGVNEVTGILVEELRLALDKVGVSAPFIGISYKRLKEDAQKLEVLIR